MATDIFSLREKDKRLPIEQQDIPPDADSQWAIDYEVIHGYTPTSYDRDRRDWSIRFASQYGRTPERADWERNYYKEQTPKEKAIGAGKPEFVARPSSGVDRSRTGELIVPFPWQADESGAETDMTARFRQYDRWDSQRGQYARGTPEWNTLTTAMNQLQTPTAPWYFSFTKKFGLRDEVLQIAGNRTGQDRVQAIANWIRQKQAQGVDPFNQADPYSAAYKAQAAQATSATTEAQRRPGGGYILEATQGEGPSYDIGISPTGPRLDELRPGPVRFPELEGDLPPAALNRRPTEATLPGLVGAGIQALDDLPPETKRQIGGLPYNAARELVYRLTGVNLTPEKFTEIQQSLSGTGQSIVEDINRRGANVPGVLTPSRATSAYQGWQSFLNSLLGR